MTLPGQAVFSTQQKIIQTSVGDAYTMPTKTKNSVGRPATFGNRATALFPAQNIPTRTINKARRFAKTKGMPINKLVNDALEAFVNGGTS